MGTVIDTLQIIVEADSRGIEQTLKKVVATATGVVNDINKQEVDWTSIFTRSVTPAIISGVASMFAFAISQSLQFQQALNTTGTAAGESTNQIATTGKAALGMSQTVTSSAQDISNAMLQVSALFGNNTTATNQVTQAMAMLADSGFGSLNDIVTASMEVFRQWGVSTATDAISVLTDLMHGAEGAKESIPALANQFLSFTPQLINSGANLSSFNQILSTFSSEIENLGATQAQAVFTTLADSAEKVTGPMELAGISMQKIRQSLVNDGGLSAIEQLSNTMSTTWGNNVVLIANALGLSDQNVEAFINSGKAFPKVATDAKAIATNVQSITDAFNQSDSALRELLKDWNTFKAASITDAGFIGKTLSGIFITAWKDAEQYFSDVSSAMSTIATDISNGSFGKAFTDVFKMAGKELQDLIVTPAAQIGAGIANATGTISAGALNSNLQATGVGFSSSSLQRLDKTASDSGLLESLINAMQTGIKSGQYTQLTNTFHLTVPAGSTGLTAKMIAQQLYAQFQGTQ